MKKRIKYNQINKINRGEIMTNMDEKTYKIQIDSYNEYLENLKKLVSNTNNLESLIEKVDDYPLNLRGNILYNLGGALNHERYFKSISQYKTNISNNLLEQIKKDFNSVENLEKEILNESLKLKGSGYVNLVLDNNKLRIILTSNEDIPEYYGFKTLMTIDLWEHAYIIMYELDRYTYVKRLLEHINYEYISKIYEEKNQK